MWGRVRIPRLTYPFRCKPGAKTTGEGCSCRGLPELLKKRSPPYARPQHGVSFCGGSDSPCHRDVIELVDIS